MGLTGDEGVVPEALVLACIGHLHDPWLLDGVSAKGDGALRLSNAVEAAPRLEPLTVFVDEGDQGDWRITDVRGQEGEVVEGFLRVGIENAIAPEGGQAGLFVDWGHADLGGY